MGHLFECETQHEEQISQENIALKKKMKKRKKLIKEIEKGVVILTGEALFAGVVTAGAFIAKHIKWGDYIEWNRDTHLEDFCSFVCYHDVEFISYFINIIYCIWKKKP